MDLMTWRIVAAWVLCALACGVRAEEAMPLRVLLVSGSAEYDSDASLEELKKHLEEDYGARATLIKARGFHELDGLEALDDCDVALFFTRRLEIDGEALERIKNYCEAGRPIVAVRTASHGFQKWLDLDRLVLGGSYSGHAPPGLTTRAVVRPGAEGHPVLEGIGEIRSRATLYRTSPLAADAEVLLTGTTPGGSEPLAWTRLHRGGRVFYTSLGAREDFENASFRRLLANAVHWAAWREPRRKALLPVLPRPRPEGTMRLPLRTRVETFKGSGAWDEVVVDREVSIAGTAIIICDLWDHHWCKGAEERAGLLAAKMAPVIETARKRGIQVIHAPSETLGFYADSVQRRRMALAREAPLPEQRLIAETRLPIDDSDGGCDTEEKPWYPAWTRQDARISIGEPDGITDSGREVHNFAAAEGIDTLIFMGVHTNMCVLGRSFGMRQMTRWGYRCILVRDLTDSMYDPKDPPRVSHDRGTELVVEHIERYWGPSVSSEELVKSLFQ
jgi:type 1 glutamine amidotransferase/nicotinamidase-related amidase